MILAADIPWLDISISLLLILFVLNCLLLSLLILMQRPKQEGLGAAFGSGMTDQVFGAQTTSVLQKGTVYLGVMFFVLTLTLAILYSKKSENTATMKRDAAEQVEKETATETEPEADEPTEPVVAEEPDEPSLEDQYGDVLEQPESDAGTEESGESTDNSTEEDGAEDSGVEATEEESAPAGEPEAADEASGDVSEDASENR